MRGLITKQAGSRGGTHSADGDCVVAKLATGDLQGDIASGRWAAGTAHSHGQRAEAVGEGKPA